MNLFEIYLREINEAEDYTHRLLIAECVKQDVTKGRLTQQEADSLVEKAKQHKKTLVL